MMRASDMRARNQRLALVLIAAMAFLYLGSVLYIDWFHSAGPGAPAPRQK
jgi:hypothetical protein